MLIETLQKGIEERRKQDEGSEFHLNPSGLGRCPRELLLQLIGAYIFEPDDLLYSIFSDGDLHEEQTIREFEKSGVEVIGKQVPFLLPIDDLKGKIFFRDLSDGCRHCGMTYPGHVIHGHMDFVVRHAGKDIVVEHKAVGNSAFADIIKACESYSDPGGFLLRAFRPYFTQLGIYLKSAKEALKNGSDSLLGIKFENPVIGILLFKNRNNSQKLEVVVEYDDEFDTLNILSLTTFPELVTYEVNATQPRFFESVVETIESLYNAYSVVKKHSSNGTLDKEGILESAEWREVIRQLVPYRTCQNCSAADICAEWFEQGVFQTDYSRIGKQKRSIILEPDTIRKDERLREIYELYKIHGDLDAKLREIKEARDKVSQKMLTLMKVGEIYRVPSDGMYLMVSGGWEKISFSKSKLDKDELEELKKSKFWKAFQVSKTKFYVRINPISKSKYDK